MAYSFLHFKTKNRALKDHDNFPTLPVRYFSGIVHSSYFSHYGLNSLLQCCDGIRNWCTFPRHDTFLFWVNTVLAREGNVKLSFHSLIRNMIKSVCLKHGCPRIGSWWWWWGGGGGG